VTSIALVVAVADNGVIGHAGKLPWHLPDDLKHFKATTMGKPVLMGRRTFQSIGRPLPGRRNLVMCRSGGVGTASLAGIDGIERVHSLEEALGRVSEAVQLCVIGGAEIYALTLRAANCVYLTQVHAAVEGDTYFPLAQLQGWREAERVEHAVDARHCYPMSFVRLERPDG
jgi:dihydrofolate reductase